MGARADMLRMILATLAVWVMAATISPAPAVAQDTELFGRRVAGVDVSGREAMDGSKLDRALGRFEGRTLGASTERNVVAAILEIYRQNGFLDARVTAVGVTPWGDAVRLAVTLDEGAQITLGRIEVVGATMFTPAQVLAMMDLRAGEPFDVGAFEAGVGRVLDAYENGGRPFVRVEPRDLTWDDSVDVTIFISEGSAITIGRVEVRGNTSTTQTVVERIAGLEVGAPFRQADLESARSRLMRSGLFQSVSPIELAQDTDRTSGVAIVEVREGRPNRMVGVVGYNGPEQGVTGLFDMELGNISGSGRRARVRWEGRGNGVSLFDLGYAEPWLLGTPLTLELALGRTIQDTLYTLNSFELVGDVDFTPELRAGIGWERESTVQPLGFIRGTARNALIARARYDSRDSRLNPRRGTLLRAQGGLARKTLRPRDPLEPEDRVRARMLTAWLEQAQAWAPTHVTFIRARIMGISSDEPEIPFYELYPVGGATTLRGYREEQFRGSRVGLITFEQRIVLDADGSRVFGFVDAGYISTRQTAQAPLQGSADFVKAGFGAGLRLATRLGMVGVDYGIGEGDGPLDGKIHFLLEAAF